MAQTITVSGMSCEGCEQTVEEAVRSLPGVESVEADHSSDSATIDGDAEPDAIRRAIEEAGYQATI